MTAALGQAPDSCKGGGGKRPCGEGAPYSDFLGARKKPGFAIAAPSMRRMGFAIRHTGRISPASMPGSRLRALIAALLVFCGAGATAQTVTVDPARRSVTAEMQVLPVRAGD